MKRILAIRREERAESVSPSSHCFGQPPFEALGILANLMDRETENVVIVCACGAFVLVAL